MSTSSAVLAPSFFRSAGAERWLPMALFCALVLLWAYNYVVMKQTLQATTPITHLILRTTLGSLTLLGVLLARGRAIRPQRLVQAAQVGLSTTFLYSLSITLALVAGAAGRTSVLVFTMPFWVALLSRWLLAEPFNRRTRQALAAGFAGLMLIVAPWQLHGGVLPMALAVLAGFFWALGSVLSKRATRDGGMDSLNFSAWQAVIGLLPLLALWPWADFAHIRWSAGFVLGMLYAGILSSAVGWLAWLWLLKRLPASTLSFNALVIPVLAVAMAASQLGEWPASRELAGMLLVGAGIVLIARR
jgi:drug/metabolite transporter (DMT)-like permease